MFWLANWRDVIKISAVALRNFPVSPRATTRESKHAQATPTNGDEGQVNTSPLLAVANLNNRVNSESENKVEIITIIVLNPFRTDGTSNFHYIIITIMWELEVSSIWKGLNNII